MGDAHSVTIPEKNYEAALAAIPNVARDLRRLHEAGALPPLAGPNGSGEPKFEDHEIAFNGVRPHRAETCYLGPTGPAPGSTKRDLFTKTAHEPYDLAVMAAYALWWHHSDGAIKVDSDGDLDDWKPALELLKDNLGYVVNAQQLFDISYAHFRFDNGLEIVLELKHQSASITGLSRSWLLHTLHLLSVKTFADKFGPLNDAVLALLRGADFSRWPTLLYHGRDPVPGFGQYRVGPILFANTTTVQEEL